MHIRKPRYAPIDAARRGDEIYDLHVRPKLEPDHNGEIVAIDLDSGAWEVGPDQDTAANRLESRLQDPQIMVMRVGTRFIARFGAGRGKNIG